MLVAASVGNVAVFAGGQDTSYSNVVDLYNSVTGTWSTAQLSVARQWIAATSVGNLAMFGGGETSGALVCMDWKVLDDGRVWCEYLHVVHRCC